MIEQSKNIAFSHTKKHTMWDFARRTMSTVWLLQCEHFFTVESFERKYWIPSSIEWWIFQALIHEIIMNFYWFFISPSFVRLCLLIHRRTIVKSALNSKLHISMVSFQWEAGFPSVELSISCKIIGHECFSSKMTASVIFSLTYKQNNWLLL